MRCPQCGFDAAQGAQFCSRCGTRLFAPKPASVREFALLKIRPSLWYYANFFVIGVLVIGGAARLLYVRHDLWKIGFALLALGVIIIASGILANRATDWSLTSDRIIEHRGLLSSNRREMELADIRSVEVSQRLMQRILRLGNVTIASAASVDFVIRLNDIAHPNEVAETVRKARLKRLA
jgi:uncharacterized membrane protein YdbT with pleckstrin-like domain